LKMALAVMYPSTTRVSRAGARLGGGGRARDARALARARRGQGMRAVEGRTARDREEDILDVGEGDATASTSARESEMDVYSMLMDAEATEGEAVKAPATHGRRDEGVFALVGTPGRCVTTFRVRKRTKFGQRVVLAGSIPELGSWQVLSAGVRCAPEGDDWWSATVCVEVPASRIVGEESFVCEYNFAVVDEVSDPVGPVYAWRSGTSALRVPSHAFMVEVMDDWSTEPKTGMPSLTESVRLNEPTDKRVLQYFTGGASKCLRGRDERPVKSEIWFPTDDCAVVTEDGEVVEVLENNNSDDGEHALLVGDVYLGTVIAKVPNMNSLLVGVEMKNGKYTKTVLLRDGLATPAAWWSRQGSTDAVAEVSCKPSSSFDEDVVVNEQLARSGRGAYGMYNVGDSVIVEIIRDSREHKGAIATAEPSLTGRYTVFKGTSHGVTAHASKKLSVVTRETLALWGESFLRNIWRSSGSKRVARSQGFHGGGAHVIMRSASMNAPRESLENEIRELSNQWRLMCISAVKSIEKARARKTPLVPRLMWRDNTNFRGMVLRELCSLNVSSVVVPSDLRSESLSAIEKSVSNFRADMEDMSTRVRTEENSKMNRLMQRAFTFPERVSIPGTSSAQLVIQATEALTAIDVNTGSCRMSVAEINVLAARTAAHEIRRRNISGIIVIDFVNAANPRTRTQIYRQIEAEFADAATRDRGKISFVPISTFGLMEITRSHIAYGPKVEVNSPLRDSQKSAASRWLDQKRKTR